LLAASSRPDCCSIGRCRTSSSDLPASSSVAKYYGAAAGRQLTTLLKDHIAIAGDIVKAAMAGDKAAQKTADDRWHQNATQIAAS
jgi:hypothetical protein